MTDTDLERRYKELSLPAYAAYDAAQLEQAVSGFNSLLRRFPDSASAHYMLGLAHKYLGNWRQSLKHNLLAQKYREEFDEAAAWVMATTNNGSCGSSRIKIKSPLTLCPSPRFAGRGNPTRD